MMQKRETERINAFVPPAMKAWLEQRAVENFSSLNAELVRTIKFRMEAEAAEQRAQ